MCRCVGLMKEWCVCVWGGGRPRKGREGGVEAGALSNVEIFQLGHLAIPSPIYFQAIQWEHEQKFSELE